MLDAADHVGLMHVWAGFQWVFGTRGRFEEWGRAAEQALFHSRQAGRADFFHGLTGALIAGPRPADEAAQTLEITLGDHHNLVSAKAYLLAMLGHFDEAWTMATAANRQHREMTGKKRNTDTLGDIAGLAGDYEEAARQHRLYCDSLEEAGRLNILSTHGPILGRYLALLGRYEEAEPLAQLGRELGDEEDVVTQAFWRQVQALVLTHCGEHEEAERLAREAVARIEQTDALNFQGDALCDLATVLEQAGRAEEARAVLEEALTRYERKKNVAMVAQVRQRFGASEDAVRLV